MRILIPLIILLDVILMHPHHADAQVIFHGPRHDKIISLTFDACPSSVHGGFDERITQTLVDSGVPATFFLTGKWILKHRNVVLKLAGVHGFEFGNHSFTHPHCLTMLDDSIKQELLRTEALLKSITGSTPKLFRPPYGETDQRVDSVAKTLGITTVMYDLASGDPDSTISRERLIQYVITRACNGSIIVMHMNGRGWYTGEVLPAIIQGLRARGFGFSKVSELMKSQKRNGSSGKEYHQ
jgi:peptidoglycan-N-acetylglucosamine deacetylase